MHGGNDVLFRLECLDDDDNVMEALVVASNEKEARQSQWCKIIPRGKVQDVGWLLGAICDSMCCIGNIMQRWCRGET